jgi:hypothetical protein
MVKVMEAPGVEDQAKLPEEVVVVETGSVDLPVSVQPDG